MKMKKITPLLILSSFFIFSIGWGQEAKIWKTGQTTCYDSSGNAIDCANTGQDGDIQAGVEWPDPRFTDNGNGTITDNLTGLMWLKDANCFDPTMVWQDALDKVADLNANPSSYYCGSYSGNYTDWRLPNRKELFSLVDYSNGSSLLEDLFENVKCDYWSSSTCVHSKDGAWRVKILNGGHMIHDNKSSNNNYVWSVRSGQ